MTKIICKLFGSPQIIKEGESIHFPYAKINALLYYMLIAKTASRDEVSGLLWPNESDDIAKRNLRNAIYQAKKTLGANIILSPSKSTLILNETLDIQIDVDQFLASPQDGLEYYTGDFLQGFFLKDSENYEYWVVRMRNAYREKFSLECYAKIENDLKNKRYSQAGAYIHQLVAQDEYDERNRRLLMRFYQETGQDGKAIETYYELSELLHNELGITPDQSTKELYESSLERIYFSSEKSRSDDNYLYNRDSELAVLEKMLRVFESRGEGCQSALITGEPGSGKSTMLRKVLEHSRSLFTVEVHGQLVKQAFPLRPCRDMLHRLLELLQSEHVILPGLYQQIMSNVFPDFQNNPPAPAFFSQSTLPAAAVLQLLVEALRTLAERRPVLLAVENLQWLDADSLRLLTAVLLETAPADVMLLATHDREHSPELDNAVSELKASRGLIEVPLERLSVKTCHQVIKNALPGQEVSGELLEQVYNETKGNPFFLSAAIENIKQNKPCGQISHAVEEFLQRRFFSLAQDTLDVAELLSFFREGCGFDTLQKLMEDRREDDLLSALDNLRRRGILQEQEGEDGCIISFTHPRLGVYLYNRQPRAKRQYLHRKIGCLFEDRLSAGDPAANKLCSVLVYHFSRAGDRFREMKYRLSILNRQLNFSHEVFPILDGDILELNFPPYLSRMSLDELFQDLEATLREIRRSMAGSGELDLLELQFYYLRGRSSILSGAYEAGINDITYMIRKSKQIQAVDYTAAGYKQMIVYYIQTDNPKKMGQYVEMALNLMLQCNNHKEIGIMLRMKGLYHMMIGKYRQGEALLAESIRTFSVSNEAVKYYAINIAAAYDYIGEIRLVEKRYSDALQLFNKAISLCTNQALSSLSYFFLNAGKAAYFSGDSAAARDYFEQAGKLYQRFDFIWRRPTLDAYLALLLWEEGDVRGSLEHLDEAQKRMWSMEDPRDSGAVFFAQALICQMADLAPDLPVQKLLINPADYYCQQARKFLNPHLDQYELKRLGLCFGEADQGPDEDRDAIEDDGNPSDVKRQHVL